MPGSTPSLGRRTCTSLAPGRCPRMGSPATGLSASAAPRAGVTTALRSSLMAKSGWPPNTFQTRRAHSSPTGALSGARSLHKASAGQSARARADAARALPFRHDVEANPAGLRSRESMNKLIDRYAVVFVAVAATLWASDAYFRNQLVSPTRTPGLSAPQIVVAEDALVTLFLLPILIRNRHELRALGARGWLAVATIAAGAQALATILFTASFSIAAQHQVFAETV